MLKETVLIAILITILVVQELILSYIPGWQLTTLLLVVYAKVFKVKKSFTIVFLYVILDNLFTPLVMGSNIRYIMIPFMLVGWGMLVVAVNLFDKKNNATRLALIGFLFGFLFSWILIIPSLMMTQRTLKDYLLFDFFFEVSFAVCNFITILWIFPPIYELLNKQVKSIYEE